MFRSTVILLYVAEFLLSFNSFEVGSKYNNDLTEAIRRCLIDRHIVNESGFRTTRWKIYYNFIIISSIYSNCSKKINHKRYLSVCLRSSVVRGFEIEHAIVHVKVCQKKKKKGRKKSEKKRNSWQRLFNRRNYHYQNVVCCCRYEMKHIKAAINFSKWIAEPRLV